jgi:tRNA threonylcarbamoyl adenosine modification protein YeaZ
LTLNLLVIDTSAGTSIAILRGSDVLGEVNVADTKLHAESIGTAIAQALVLAGLKGSEIQAVVVGRGPAPFTGLRVGIAAGTVFAQAVGARLFGAVSLDALAWAALQDPELAAKVSTRTPLLITSDARRSEVFWALYTGLSSNGVPMRTDLPAVNKPAALDELLIDRNVDAVRLDAHTEVTGPATSQSFEGAAIGTALGRVAQALLVEGELGHDTSALYLRAPDAVLPKPHARYGKAEYSKPVLAGGGSTSNSDGGSTASANEVGGAE